MVTEANKKAQRKWIENHRQQVNENNRKWRQENKEKWNKASLKYRKKKAQEFKEKGMMFVYLARTERELKTINYLCRKLNINEDEARRLLIDNEWNIKKILQELT